MARKVPSKERTLPKLFKGNLVEYVQVNADYKMFCLCISLDMYLTPVNFVIL